MNKTSKYIIGDDLINQALSRYVAKGTRYVQDAVMEKGTDEIAELYCRFSIPESAFLHPGSEHFNAVDAMICFNQMAFVYLIGGIHNGLHPFYNGVSVETFNKNRRNVFILEYEKVKFKNQIDNNNFFGRMQMNRIKTVGDKMYMDSEFQYGNEVGNRDFFGNVKLFIPVLGR